MRLSDRPTERLHIAARLSLAFVVTISILAPRLSTAADAERRVVAAALATYIHGMTAAIADEAVGEEGVPVLLQLLADPAFARRDNVVAFLTYLGDDSATDALLAFLKKPPAPVGVPEEDRALLLTPEALGHIASRGNPRALDALMNMTAAGSNGGLLATAAARASRPAVLRDDLLESALRGLALSGSAEATGRLREIAEGRVVPALGGRSLRSIAGRVLDGFGAGDGPAAVPSPAASPGALLDGLGVGGTEGEVAAANDTQQFSHDSRIDYANHVDHNNPITDARVDAIFAEGSARVGRSDFSADVACCVSYSRKGSQKTFGSQGDGLDRIDLPGEDSTVLSHPAARVKVVRSISWCGGPGTNIIGCGYVGGKGIAVVRLSGLGIEAVLWVHEYGHNTNLGHNPNGLQWIMNASTDGTNHAVNQGECDHYHAPVSGAQADIVQTGTCGGGPVCGNSIAETGEDCDGPDLGGETCETRGFDGGTLGCQGNCTFDTSTCTECGDGVRNPGEDCDGTDLGGASCSDQSCTAGTPACTPSCTVDYSTCSGCPVCDGDGTCESGEDCNGCPGDCLSGNGASCGNGVCEAGDGEDCILCPADCNGKQNGKPSGRFCCGDGDGENPIPCSHSTCTSAGFSCSDTPSDRFCCGDGECTGAESSGFCEVDCGPAPFCGDTICDPGEDQCDCAVDCGSPPATEGASCSDGVDNDCDGFADCADVDCGTAPGCDCTPVGETCVEDVECCTLKCRGKNLLCR